MRTFSDADKARHAYQDASDHASNLRDALKRAEIRLGQNIIRNKRHPHALWQSVIQEGIREVTRLRQEVAAARLVEDEAREALPLIERAA